MNWIHQRGTMDLLQFVMKSKIYSSIGEMFWEEMTR